MAAYPHYWVDPKMGVTMYLTLNLTNYFRNENSDEPPRSFGLFLRVLLEHGYYDDYVPMQGLLRHGFLNWNRIRLKSSSELVYIFDAAIVTKRGLDWLASLPEDPLYFPPFGGDPLDRIPDTHVTVYTQEFLENVQPKNLPEYHRRASKGWTIGYPRSGNR